MLVGVYHLQACTVLVDVSTSGQTQTSTTGQTTSVDLTSTGLATTSEGSTTFDSTSTTEVSSNSTSLDDSSSSGSSGSETHAALCGDCIQHFSEECDPCLYKNQFMSSCQNVITAKCQLAFFPAPQLDCTNNWLGNVGCDQEEADLYCQILTKDSKAKAKDFSLGSYIATRGLFAQQELNKEGVELISVPETIYPDVFYYEKNPYLVPTMTLEIPDGGCFIE